MNLFNRDCMEAMKEMKDNQYDLAIVDPPYFSDYGKKDYPGNEISTTGIKRNMYDSKNWDIPNQDYFNELMRVSKRQIVWGINYYWDIRFPHTGGRIIWDKQNDYSSFSQCEIALYSALKGVRIFRYTWNGMIQGDMKNKEKRIHPTQKPVALYKWILKNYAKVGDSILDTHLGSMSIAIACHDMGYKLTGFEIDKDYYDSGIKRVNTHKSQLTINEG